MKRICKTTATLSVSALLAIAASLVCLNINHRAVRAEENSNHRHNVVAYQHKEENFDHRGKVAANLNDDKIDIDLPQLYSGFPMSANNIATYSTYAVNSVNSLLYSTVYGNWSESFKQYNCYAFALGRTDKYYIIGGPSGNTKSGNIFWELWQSCNPSLISKPIGELANYVNQDLHSLGYECVTSTKNTFYAPTDTQTLICVRKSQNDFHFMKYVDGDWLHKPGWTWILKYNSTPNVSEDWLPEAAYMEDGKIVYDRGGYPYTGDIYFIKYANSHINSYQYKDASQHYIKCKNCEYTFGIEAHTFVPYFSKKQKGKRCSGCNYIVYEGGMGHVTMQEGDNKI